jgi:hypothetical protein
VASLLSASSNSRVVLIMRFKACNLPFGKSFELLDDELSLSELILLERSIGILAVPLELLLFLCCLL